MKKIICCFILIAFVFVLTGCGSKGGNVETHNLNESFHVQSDTSDAFFEFKGVTFGYTGVGFDTTTKFARIETTIDCTMSTQDECYNFLLSQVDLVDESGNELASCLSEATNDSIPALIKRGETSTGYLYCETDATSAAKIRVRALNDFTEGNYNDYLIPLN